MTINAVFGDIRSDSGNAIFDRTYQTGETYTKTLTVVQDSTVELTQSASTVRTYYKTLSTSAVNSPSVAKMRAKTLSTSEATTLEVYTATTLLTAVAPVSQSGIATARRGLAFSLSATQDGVPSIASSVTGGSEHTTYPKTLATTQGSSATTERDIQTVKTVTQASLAPQPEMLVTPVEGGTTYVMQILAIQSGQAIADLLPTIAPPRPPDEGGPHGVGWMLEPIAPEPKRREPTTAELRKAARDEMQVAKRRMAAEARLAEEQRIREAEAEVERVRGMLAQIDLLDAAVKPKYEQEIQALQQQQQAAIGEIMRLRAELMQAEQAQVQMSSRDKAVALLLSQ